MRLNPRKFTTCHIPSMAYLEQEPYLKPCETLTRHIQNHAMGHSSAIVRILSNVCICRNLAYLRKFTYVQNTDIF